MHCRDDGGSSPLRPSSSWRAGMVCGILFEVHRRVHFNALSQTGRGVGERYYQVDQGSIIQLRYNGEKNLLCWKSRIEFEPKTAETSTCLYTFNSLQQGSLTRPYEACYQARFLSCPSDGCFYGRNWSGLVFLSACEMSSVAALFQENPCMYRNTGKYLFHPFLSNMRQTKIVWPWNSQASHNAFHPDQQQQQQ